MSDLPLPLPDRRTLAKSSKQQNNKFDKNKFSKKEMEQIDSDNKNTINSEIRRSISFFGKIKTNRRYETKNS